MRRAKRLSIFFFIMGFCTCLLLTGTIRFLSTLDWSVFSHRKVSEKVFFYPVGRCPDCKKIADRHWRIGALNDNNPVHLECAQRMGIQPFQTNAELEARIESLLQQGTLQKLEDTDTYKLKKLTHSYPYLVPRGVELLNEIGLRFEEKLRTLGIPPYYMMISSVLRTNESQNGLGKRNGNATTVSAHIYGTTFDLSYKEFLPMHGHQAKEGFCRHDMLRHPLAEVLTELSEQGRCKVVIEKRQACFHITVAN